MKLYNLVPSGGYPDWLVGVAVIAQNEEEAIKEALDHLHKKQFNKEKLKFKVDGVEELLEPKVTSIYTGRFEDKEYPL